MRFISNSALLAAAVGSVVFTSVSKADLSIDLRFADGSHNRDYIPGDLTPITFNAWAIVTGTSGNNNPEGLQNAMFAVKSNIITGGVAGSITSASHATGWTGNGANLGAASNLSNDSIGDWGNDANNTIPIGISSFFRIRTSKSVNNASDWGDADSPVGSVYNTLPNSGREFLVGSFTFTPTAMPIGSVFQFVPVTPLSGTTSPAGWWEDSTDKFATSPSGGRTHITGNYGPDTPNSSGLNAITIGVPEPTSMGLLGIAAIGVLKRFRKNQK